MAVPESEPSGSRARQPSTISDASPSSDIGDRPTHDGAVPIAADPAQAAATATSSDLGPSEGCRDDVDAQGTSGPQGRDDADAQDADRQDGQRQDGRGDDHEPEPQRDLTVIHGRSHPAAPVTELEALRRRLDDLGVQQRKSHAATQQLTDSIAALVVAHRRRLRWLNLNSFVAYVIFTVLLGAAFYLLYARRSAALSAEQRELVKSRSSEARRGDDGTGGVELARQRLQRALEVAARYASDDYAAAVAEHDALRATLTPSEAVPLERVRAKAANTEFERWLRDGMSAFHAGAFAAAVEPLRKAAAVGADAGSRPGVAQYYLGVSLARTGDLTAAQVALSAALAASVEIEDARYQLATVFDRAGQIARARSEYDAFATAHRKLALAEVATRRSAVLARWGRAAAPLPAMTRRPSASRRPSTAAPVGDPVPRPAVPDEAEVAPPTGSPDADSAPPSPETP